MTTRSFLEAPTALRIAELPGVVSYNPRVQTELVIRGRIVSRVSSLFPRFIFISGVAGRWRALAETRGVAGVMPVEGAWAEARLAAEVARLRSGEVNGLYQLPLPPVEPPLQRGERLVVVEGPAINTIVIFQGMRGEERVRCLSQFMGAQVRAEFKRSAVQRAPVEALVA